MGLITCAEARLYLRRPDGAPEGPCCRECHDDGELLEIRVVRCEVTASVCCAVWAMNERERKRQRQVEEEDRKLVEADIRAASDWLARHYSHGNP
jgi:hypothetical protein